MQSDTYLCTFNNTNDQPHIIADLYTAILYSQHRKALICIEQETVLTLYHLQFAA